MSEMTPHHSNELPTMPNLRSDVNQDAPTILESTRVVSSTRPPQRFGDYELISEIARGGMGVVYRARQIPLDRIVALKMVLAGRLADEDDKQRFMAEAGAAGQLQHPNIVAVHEVGEVEGQPFFSMEFIEGDSLNHRLQSGPLGSKLAARFVLKIARAIHYAHQQGILHRDLKPSNILLDASDDPHITDFGLAKRLTHDTGQTRSGAVLGTPSYMAPEQAEGKSRELGPACDVYGLGAVLYELLTGRPPFKAETAIDTAMQVIHNDPVPPRLLNPKIDVDLETICLKCLEKEPRDRYASAALLAQDLERYLDGESINARSFNILDRLTRTLDRSRHDAAFHTWSNMLLIMAVVVCAEHMIVFALLQLHQPRWMVQGMRVTQFSILAFLFWYHRGSQLMPTSNAERELWTIWIGYFLTYGYSILITRLLVHHEIIQVSEDTHLWQEILPYPFISAASGLALFIMGCNYWGWCYALGLIFFIVAGLMPLHLEWAPLEFGLLWTLALTALGLRLRKLSQVSEIEARSDPRTLKFDRTE